MQQLKEKGKGGEKSSQGNKLKISEQKTFNHSKPCQKL